MLSGALGADHLAVLEFIHPLTGIDRVAIHSSQRIGKLFLTAEAVAAVLRLAIHGIPGDANSIRLLLHQRHIVSACAVTG